MLHDSSLGGVHSFFLVHLGAGCGAESECGRQVRSQDRATHSKHGGTELCTFCGHSLLTVVPTVGRIIKPGPTEAFMATWPEFSHMLLGKSTTSLKKILLFF